MGTSGSYIQPSRQLPSLSESLPTSLPRREEPRNQVFYSRMSLLHRLNGHPGFQVSPTSNICAFSCLPHMQTFNLQVSRWMMAVVMIADGILSTGRAGEWRYGYPPAQGPNFPAECQKWPLRRFSSLGFRIASRRPREGWPQARAIRHLACVIRARGWPAVRADVDDDRGIPLSQKNATQFRLVFGVLVC